MPGSRQHHPRPFTVRELAAIRSTLISVIDETPWTQKDVTRAIADLPNAGPFKHVSADDLRFCECAMSTSTISRWQNKQTNISQWHAWAICLWLKETFRAKIDDALRNASIDYKEPFAFLFQEMAGSEIDFKGLATLKGDYRLYRPCFHKPESQVLASLFTIGSKESGFDCTMRTKSPVTLTKKNDEVVRGKIIPEMRSMMCVLTAPRSRFTFVIHFHEIQRDNDDVGAVRFMIGVMLAASGGFPSTAWPVFAQRLGEKDKLAPRIIPAHQVARLDPMILEALSRGIVHSDKRLYPGLPITR